MKKPKCAHAFILHSFPMIKSLPIVSILYPFGSLMNFRIYTWDFLPFKPNSHLIMVCYHQNPIGRTLGLTLRLHVFIGIHSTIICSWVTPWNTIALIISCNPTHKPTITERNFFRSLADAILHKRAKPRLISILKAKANCRTRSFGMWTSGMCGGALLMKVVALDHKNYITSASIEQWHTKVSRWYSSNSNRIHTVVSPPSTPVEIFFFSP